MTVSGNVAAGSINTDPAQNKTVAAGPYGGQAARFLYFRFANAQDAQGYGSQVVTLSFSQPVTNVSFTFYDIDSLTGYFADKVVLTPTPTSRTIPAGGHVTGAGTTTSPLQNTTANNEGSGSTVGNTTVTFAGPVSSVQFHYYQSFTLVSGTTPQYAELGISNLTFTPTSC